MTSHSCGSESNPFQKRYSTYTVQNEGMIVSLFVLDDHIDYHFRRGFCFVCSMVWSIKNWLVNCALQSVRH